MLPVVEGNNGLLFYPVQYEGLEASKNIYYTGATTNQQIIPAMDFLKSKGVKTLFLAGSDYVFPRTANKIIKQYAAELGIEIVGEEYVPLDKDDWSTQVAKIVEAKPDFVFNTINGSSNVGFIKAYYEQGLPRTTTPIISVSIAEEEAPAMGDDLPASTPPGTTSSPWRRPANDTSSTAFQDEYARPADLGPDGGGVHLALPLQEHRGEGRDLRRRQGQRGVRRRSFDSPEGEVIINGENHHIAKTSLIGQINSENLFDIVWASEKPIEPDPFLEGYDWWDPSAT